jgi:hypothetical protein
MIRIHTILIGQPGVYSDAKGEWQSSIYRQPVAGPVALGARGLAGDRVTDVKNHGKPDQAVCCHPLAHYAYWNEVYGLTGAEALGAGALGENWTLDGADETNICVGDVYDVGSARVQVVSPTDGDVALHITQSVLAQPSSLATTADTLLAALAESADGAFVDFNPSDRRADRDAVTYREIRPERNIAWAVVIDGTARIAIGCQSLPRREHLVRQACDRAIRSAHAVS